MLQEQDKVAQDDKASQCWDFRYKLMPICPTEPKPPSFLYLNSRSSGLTVKAPISPGSTQSLSKSQQAISLTLMSWYWNIYNNPKDEKNRKVKDSLHNFKSCYKTTGVKTMLNKEWQKDKHTDRGNNIKSLEVNPQIKGKWVLIKIPCQSKERAVFNKWSRDSRLSACTGTSLEFYLTPWIKINSKHIKDLNPSWNYKTLPRKPIHKSQWFGIHQMFLVPKNKVDKLDFAKIRNFVLPRTLTKNEKTTFT